MDNANIISDETRKILYTFGKDMRDQVDFGVSPSIYKCNISPNHSVSGIHELLQISNDHPVPF